MFEGGGPPTVNLNPQPGIFQGGQGEAQPDDVVTGPPISLYRTLKSTDAPSLNLITVLGYFTGTLLNLNTSNTLDVVIIDGQSQTTVPVPPTRSLNFKNQRCTSLQVILDPSNPTATILYTLQGRSITPLSDKARYRLEVASLLFFRVTPIPNLVPQLISLQAKANNPSDPNMRFWQWWFDKLPGTYQGGGVYDTPPDLQAVFPQGSTWNTSISLLPGIHSFVFLVTFYITTLGRYSGTVLVGTDTFSFSNMYGSGIAPVSPSEGEPYYEYGLRGSFII